MRFPLPLAYLSHYMQKQSQRLWIQPQQYQIVVGHPIMIVTSCNSQLLRRRSVLNLLVTKRRKEWKTIGGSFGDPMHGSTLTTLNVFITLWTLIRVSNSSCTSIYVQKFHFLKFPQCFHQFISHTCMISRNIV